MKDRGVTGNKGNGFGERRVGWWRKRNRYWLGFGGRVGPCFDDKTKPTVKVKWKIKYVDNFHQPHLS